MPQSPYKLYSLLVGGFDPIASLHNPLRKSVDNASSGQGPQKVVARLLAVVLDQALVVGRLGLLAGFHALARQGLPGACCS